MYLVSLHFPEKKKPQMHAKLQDYTEKDLNNPHFMQTRKSFANQVVCFIPHVHHICVSYTCVVYTHQVSFSFFCRELLRSSINRFSPY